MYKVEVEELKLQLIALEDERSNELIEKEQLRDQIKDLQTNI